MEIIPQQLNTEIRMPKKIVIHSVMKMSLEDLLKLIRTPVGNMPLMWAGGYAFILNQLPMQSKALDLFIEGEVHYSELIYCDMPEYQSVVSISHELATNVLDVSKSLVYFGISQLLKQFDELNEQAKKQEQA